MLIQEKQVRGRLRNDFEPLIDTSDIQHHPKQTVDEMRTSRALAAMCIAARAKMDPQLAAKCVVDESGDRGIDAVGISHTEETVYVVQAKASGGTPGLTDVQKFISGIRLLLNSDFDELGQKLRAHRGVIEKSMDEFPNLRVVAIFSHLGEGLPNAEVERESARLKTDINSAGEILEFEYVNLRGNFDIRNVAQGEDALNASILFNTWNTVNEYKSEIYGAVSASEISSLVDRFGDRLYDRNIRRVLSTSSVNETLTETIGDRPDMFWYYNNGITIVAGRISTDRMRPRSSDQVFDLHGLNVVNGAQTCGAIYRAAKRGHSLDDAYVTVRVISTENRAEDFESNVTRYTNTQNQVGGREFVALDPWQQELRDTLNAESIQYCFKTGDVSDLENFKFSFDLEDATRSLACRQGVVLATQAKREIGRMWTDIHKDPYTRLFNKENDAATVYNCVVFWREVNRVIDAQLQYVDARTGKILSHSAFMVTSLLMSWFGKSIDFGDIQANIPDYLSDNKEVIELFLKEVVTQHESANANGYPQSFFKNQTKVEALDGVLRKYLFQKPILTRSRNS
ncbi:AIPR family protein [Gordonia hongkongensis]|uniref:AIPR family protein n=1 Tax=Gordonia hongkongensis TaxID=1701090 RepID=UPI003EB743B5